MTVEREREREGRYWARRGQTKQMQGRGGGRGMGEMKRDERECGEEQTE